MNIRIFKLPPLEKEKKFNNKVSINKSSSSIIQDKNSQKNSRNSFYDEPNSPIKNEK